MVLSRVPVHVPQVVDREPTAARDPPERPAAHEVVAFESADTAGEVHRGEGVVVGHEADQPLLGELRPLPPWGTHRLRHPSRGIVDTMGSPRGVRTTAPPEVAVGSAGTPTQLALGSPIGEFGGATFHKLDAAGLQENDLRAHVFWFEYKK